jgi:hypothetical protein
MKPHAYLNGAAGGAGGGGQHRYKDELIVPTETPIAQTQTRTLVELM